MAYEAAAIQKQELCSLCYSMWRVRPRFINSNDLKLPKLIVQRGNHWRGRLTNTFYPHEQYARPLYMYVLELMASSPEPQIPQPVRGRRDMARSG
jgi:hypothetical protein